MTKVVVIPPDEEALATLRDVMAWYERNLREPLPFDVNWTKRYDKSPGEITDQILRARVSWGGGRPVFKAEPYWNLALGHWSADELRAGAAGIGMYDIYAQFGQLLSRHFPIVEMSNAKNWKEA
jgi:exonuclease V gamma subunit